MNLGTFSVSLAVKDLAVSRKFYEAFGFEVVGGAAEEKWLILQNGLAKIGLFEGMFDQNILTFNPEDVRAIQKRVQDAGYEFVKTADGEDGAAHAVIVDPDGNQILLDQF